MSWCVCHCVMVKLCGKFVDTTEKSNDIVRISIEFSFGLLVKRTKKKKEPEEIMFNDFNGALTVMLQLTNKKEKLLTHKSKAKRMKKKMNVKYMKLPS